jgi:hypothetical protein
MNSKEIIKKIIAEKNPDIDISDGSGVTDILVNPLSSVLDYYETTLSDLQHSLSIKNMEDYTDDELESLAENFFIERKTGSNSTGYVKIIFEKPVNITIPPNTIFLSSKNIRFYSIKEYSINSTTMSNNITSGGYETGPINIMSESVGEDQVAQKNEINSIENPNFDYIKVYNELPCLNSVPTESNEDLYNRILLAATTYTALSPASYEKILKDNFDVKNVIVKGFGDKEVTRDIAYEGTGVYNKVTSDYCGKLREYSLEPHNKNFCGYAIYSGEEPPDIYSISLNEITNNNYEGLYKLNDSLKCEINSENLIDENFDSGVLSETWHSSDAYKGIDSLMNEDEIRAYGGSVILGISQETIQNIDVCIARNEFEAIENSVKELKTTISGYIDKINSDHTREVNILKFALNKCNKKLEGTWNIGDNK